MRRRDKADKIIYIYKADYKLTLLQKYLRIVSYRHCIPLDIEILPAGCTRWESHTFTNEAPGVWHRRTLISGGLNIPSPTQVAVFENEAFWSDITMQGVLRMDMLQGESSLVTIYQNRSELPVAIKIMHKTKQERSIRGTEAVCLILISFSCKTIEI